jgi:hypothetical protein
LGEIIMYNAGTVAVPGAVVLGASITAGAPAQNLALTGAGSLGISLMALALIVGGLMLIGIRAARRHA